MKLMACFSVGLGGGDFDHFELRWISEHCNCTFIDKNYCPKRFSLK